MSRPASIKIDEDCMPIYSRYIPVRGSLGDAPVILRVSYETRVVRVVTVERDTTEWKKHDDEDGNEVYGDVAVRAITDDEITIYQCSTPDRPSFIQIDK